MERGGEVEEVEGVEVGLYIEKSISYRLREVIQSDIC